MAQVAIVGAGIAGLSAGVYARQSGFDVTIFESHYIPGGASTSWKRKGYLFEGGMHWLTGSSPEKALYGLWTEIGALNADVPIFNRDPFLTYELAGETAYLYRDVDRLEQHLIDLSPVDEREIKRLTKDLRKFAKVDMPLVDIKGVEVRTKQPGGIFGMLGMLPALSRMPFYAKQTAGEFSERFKSLLLQNLFKTAIGEDMSATGLVFTLATLASGDGGYPQGGSLAMAARIAETFESLGGEIVYRTPVNRIAVENGRATGVVIDGETRTFDAVIVTQDTLVAVDALFDPPITEPWTNDMRTNTEPLLNTFISLGIRADLSDIPECGAFALDEPIMCAGEPMSDLSINNYATYEGYAPEGCTAITSYFGGDSYDWWLARKADDTYEAEKRKLADAVIAALGKKYPQTQGKVEVWDIATPLTYERYLHSYKGSWMTNMKPGQSMPSYPAKPATIDHVYFAGQRMMTPGGLPGAAETARTAVQYLCRDTATVFQGAMGPH